MRVRELLENDDPYLAKGTQMSAEKVAELLKSRCKAFVNAYRIAEKVALRGIKEQKDDPAPFVSGLIRKDRRPLFMDMEYHELISDSMEQMGLASRRNSLFCSVSSGIARSWGSQYILFVEDGFNGVVFEKIPNEYAFDRLYDKAMDIKHRVVLSPDEQIEMMKDFLESLDPFKFKTFTGLANVLKTGYDDVLITGEKYYALSVEDDNFTCEVLRLLGINTVRNIYLPGLRSRSAKSE